MPPEGSSAVALVHLGHQLESALLEDLRNDCEQGHRGEHDVSLVAVVAVVDGDGTESDQGEAAKAYANIIAVKDGNQDSEKTKALVKALTSETAKKYIDDTYNGAVVTVF